MANTPLLIKTYIAQAAVTKRRIVVLPADGAAAQAAGATGKLMGVSVDLDAAIGEQCDVVHSGLADVEYGGAVAIGDPLTSDAQGRAVAAAPGAGVNHRIVGFAQVAGVLGDIGSLLVSPGVMQG